MKVMIVDDEFFWRAYLSMGLKEQGFDTLACATSDDARLRYPHFAPDVVLCDVAMPNGSSIAFMEAIKQVDPCSRFYFISAFRKRELKQMLVSAGADGYFEKPPNLHALGMAIRSSEVFPSLNNKTRSDHEKVIDC